MPLIPQINFNEASVGSRPILPNLRNRIGIVGQFSRGPANVFTFVDGFTEFANIFGSDAESGSVAYQAAWDQGARDFGLIRVLGRSKPACGETIFFGTAGVDNTLTINITGVQEVTQAYGTVIQNVLETSGSAYTGTKNGRFVFKVTAIHPTGGSASFADPAYVADPGAGNLEIRYVYVPYTTARSRTAAIEYATDTLLAAITETTTGIGTVAAPTSNDQGIIILDYESGGVSDANKAINLGEGVSLTLGNVANEQLHLDLGDTFSFIVESTSYNIDINAGDTAVDIINRITSQLNGADPLSDVDSDIEFLTNIADNYQGKVTFCLDQDIPTLLGAEGNRYDYTWTLANEDGVLTATGATFEFDDHPDALFTEDEAAALALKAKIDASETVYLTAVTAAGSAALTFDFVANTYEVSAVTEEPALSGIYRIDFTANFPGATADETWGGTNSESGDGVQVLTFTSQTTGFQVTGLGTTQSFSGGTTGPTFANRTFYTLTGEPLISIRAISAGKWGNNIDVTITPRGTRFQIDVTDQEGPNFNPPIQSESYLIDLTATDALDATGVITALNGSNLISGIFLPKRDNPSGFNVNLLTKKPERLAPVNTLIAGADTESVYHPSYYGPSRLQDVSLETGSDGPIIDEDDLIAAVNLLDGENVNYILAPGVDTTFKNVQAALVGVAENSTELDGLKIAILNAQPRLRPQQAENEFSHINSDRAIAIAGWVTYAGQVGLDPLSVSPDAIYAGKLATIGYTVSPAARSTSGPVINVTDTDTRKYVSRSSLQLYTDGRMEVLFPETNLGGFFFLNGITTSSDTAWDRVVIRRTYDVIRQDLFIGLQPYKSEPHTLLLRRQIETSVNAYFSTMARNGKIANFIPAICNESNNPPENYINGEINIDVSFLPLYSADYINVTISRNTDGGLQIGVGAG